MFTFSSRSIRNLRGVDVGLVLVVSRALALSPYDFAVSEGLRTRDRQAELYLRRSSKTMESKHLVGLAVDLVAAGDLDGNGKIDAQDAAKVWDPTLYMAIAERAMLPAAQELGIEIRWGGHFKDFFDGPHFELLTASY